MNIWTKLHKVVNGLMIVGITVLSAVALYLLFVKGSPTLAKHQSFEEVQTDFMAAVHSYDIKSAKRLYALLKEKNPYSPFVEETAPAYMADIYLHYADKMAFNTEAAEMFKGEARRLAPQHPVFTQCVGCNAPPQPSVDDKAQSLSSQVAEAEAVAARELTAYLEELAALEQSIESMEAAAVKDEAKQLEVELKQVQEVAVVAPQPQQQPRLPATTTDDACLLSYYTRSTPVSTCTDVLSSHQYGPSLFVIGDDKHAPLAFTQQPITVEAFNALCTETKQCQPDRQSVARNVDGLSLDLSDVETTVNHYNTFCQMTRSCESITSTNAPVLLNPDKLSQYASLLSQHTGYTYRTMTIADVEGISAYFKACVSKDQCDDAMSDELNRFLQSERKVLLVRKVSG